MTHCFLPSECQSVLVIECQFPQNPTCSLLPNTCCVHGIELCNLSIFMKSGKIQNLFGPHLLALLSLLPCSRFRIWISGCQTLQCPLTPRLSHPLSCLFPSCPKFSTPFSIPKILPVLRMWPLDSFHTFSHRSLPFTGHLTCSSLILQLLYVFTHVRVMSLDTQCVKCVLKSSDVLFHSSCHRCCVGGDDKHADMDIDLLKISFIEPFPFVLPYY